MSKSIRKPAVVLFEDIIQDQDKRQLDIQSALGKAATVLVYKGEEETPQDMPVEVLLEKLLNSHSFNDGHIGLIVSDRELGRYKSGVISDSVVLAVAEKMGIPVCLYERGIKRSGTMGKLKQWKIKEIVVDGDSKNFGEECGQVFHGFNNIARKLEEIPGKDFKKMTPPEILARVLDREEEIDRIALYGTGEQSVLLEILAYIDSKNPALELKNRYPRILGNWLYTSLLRYPGILLNEIAAASYLNIHEDDFRIPKINALFKEASYKGPFSDRGTWWWRRELDRILENNKCESGFDYARKKSNKQVRYCQCMEGKDHPAGFYCMINEQPVCREHSHGGVSWFPRGADLAMISDREYKKIGPFVGLY